MKQGRILVVDDAEQWRTELVETLRRAEFHADSASTPEMALEQLDKALYHLVILDIRFDETRLDNTDGIQLLHTFKDRKLSETVKVIMLSYYDTKDNLRTSFRDYGVVDFLSKGEFNKKIFLESVQRAFVEKVNINLSLDIRWQVGNGEEAVLNLAMNGKRVSRGSEMQSLLAIELEDLLRRLFYEAGSILVRPITPGLSATGVLEVQPFYHDMGARGKVIVKFGNTQKIEQEYSNFKKYIEHTLGGGRSTVVHGLRQTPHLGGILYSFVGVSGTRLEDFGNFYSQPATDITRIRKGLDQLFLVTCANWYENRSRLQPHNLAEDYQRMLNITPEKLERGVQALSDSVSVLGDQRLHLQTLSSERTFSNPLPTVGGRTYWYSTYVCTTHGDFNSHNILLDDSDNTWLIDFLRTGQGHILRDVAELDSVVRFVLLAEQDATLDERLNMEEALCSVDRFSQIDQLEKNFATENRELAKAYATVIHLRKLAGDLLRRSTHEDMGEYHVALLYHALNTVRFYNLSVTQREHALLCASLLADKLNL